MITDNAGGWSMEQHDLPTLGLIWPDDGFAEPDYELLRGPETVAELGVTALRLLEIDPRGQGPGRLFAG